MRRLSSLLTNGCREGEAPAEPRKTSNFPRTDGSAGASPSLFQQAVTFVVISLLLTNLAFAQPVAAPARLRESVTLPIDSQVVKSLATAADFVRDKKWALAVPVLQQIIDTRGEAILPIEVGRYGNAADYAHLLISKFPDDGLKVYRDRVDEQVRAWFEEGRRDLDEQLLRRVVQTGLLSSYGDEALWLLGELAFERGRFALARSYWELLLPEVPDRAAVDPALPETTSLLFTYPDPDFEPSALRARLVLCSLYSGDLVRADRELAAFRRLHPDDTGELAGEKGRWVQLLDQQRKAAATWSFDRPAADEVASFGGDVSRNAAATTVVEPISVNWSASLPLNPFVGSIVRPALANTGTLSTFSIVSEGVAYVCGASSVHAFDLQTGKPKWPTGVNSDGRIYASDIVSPAGNELLAFQGVPFFSLTADRGRVYARLGPPVVRRAKAQRGLFSEIVGLDVAAREGELVFHVTSDALDDMPSSPETTSWCFEGTPVVADDRVYVSARRSTPEDEIHVVCFDASSGQLVWRRRVCSTLRNVAEHFNVIGHRVLTLGDGRLFLETDTGAIAGLDAETGKLLWVSTYESTVQDETPFEYSDPTRHGLTPCVYFEGVVFVAPADSQFVMAFDAASGQFLWKQQLTDRVLHVLGVTNGKLIVSGRSLWALDARTGQFAWPQTQVGFKDPKSFGYGRGVIAVNSIFWPLHDEILQVEASSGELQHRFALRQATGEIGGNLLIAGQRLLIAQPNRLVALGAVANAPLAPKKFVTRRAPTQPSARDTGFTVIPTAGQRLAPRIATPPSTIGVAEATAGSETLSWPVQQAWVRDLGSSSQVFLPPQQGTATVEPIALVQSRHELRAFRTLDGRDIWRSALLEPLSWSSVFGTHLVLADSRRLEGRHVSTGQLLWKLALVSDDRTERLVVIQAVSARELVVATERRVGVIDATTGEIVTEFAPSREQLNSHAIRERAAPFSATAPLFAIHGPLAVFESPLLRNPLVVNLKTNRAVAETPALRGCRQALWFQTEDSAERLVTVSDDNRLQCWSPNGAMSWRSPDRLAVAFHQPSVRNADGRLVLIEDGLFARGLDLNTGRQLWSAALGRFPLRDLDQSLACVSDKLLVINDDTLTSFSTVTGRTNWQKYLGSGTWSLHANSTDTICLKSATASTPTELAVCDTQTGAAVQTLRVEGLGLQSRLLADRGAAVSILSGKDRLVGIRSMVRTAMNE